MATYEQGLALEPDNEILQSSIQKVKDRIIVTSLPPPPKQPPPSHNTYNTHNTGCGFERERRGSVGKGTTLGGIRMVRSGNR